MAGVTTALWTCVGIPTQNGSIARATYRRLCRVGEAKMEFVSGVLDDGNAPEIFVAGLERVALLSPGIVRVSLFAPTQRGDLRTTLHLLWDRLQFIGAGPDYDQARAAMLCGTDLPARMLGRH